jgi:hypothetical protein
LDVDNVDLLHQEKIAHADLLKNLEYEEAFWKEKSRLQWFKEGDRNTAFFHRTCKIRQATNAISMLKKDNLILTDPQDIASHIVDYYKNLFSTNSQVLPNNLIGNVIPSLVSDNENNILTAIPDSEEIKQAVFTLSGDSAPGPDGFGGCFYQTYWDIVAPDVCLAVQYFFQNNHLMRNYNSSNVVLIPKFKGADRVEDFRPIAITNFKFKIITKILADRLANICARIISPQQRGFIKGRHIHDCIGIASEAINLLDHKIFGGNVVIKLDIRKAFDTLDWDFLLDTIRAFGFSNTFINWVKIILHSAKLSMVVNGQAVDFFGCKRGVRQGDPLSPLLFCLAEEVLSRGISDLASRNILKPLLGPKGLVLPSHIFYADDIMILCNGSRQGLSSLMGLLQKYGSCSGQFISPNKCKFYSAGSPQIKNRIASILGFHHGSTPFNYLGVPIFSGKPQKHHLQGIADRVLSKLASWKGSLLSIMGRVQLVKSVIQSMLLYSFKIYKWPSNLLKLLDQSMRNFVWAGDIRIRKLVTVSWAKTCSDIKEGGLGIRSLSHINKASLLTFLWQVTTHDSELASMCRLRFGFPGKNTPRYYKSSIWHGLKDNWAQVVSNSQWIIGNGSSVNFWTENWLGEPLTDTFHIPLDIHHHLKAKVSDFRINGRWYLPSFIANNPVISKIRNVFFSQKPDSLVWASSSSGTLSAKEAYAHFRPINITGLWSSLWSKAIPPSKSFVIWRLLHEKMPTDDMLLSRGCHGPSRCSLCNNQEENMHHLFFTCPFAKELWNWIQATFRRHLDLSSIQNTIQDCLSVTSPQVKEAMLYSIIFTINSIWTCRNKTRFEDIRCNVRQTVGAIRNQLAMTGPLFHSTALVTQWNGVC